MKGLFMFARQDRIDRRVRRIVNLVTFALLSMSPWMPAPAYAAWTVGEPIVTYIYPPTGLINDSIAQQAVAGGYNVVWVDGAQQSHLDLAQRYGLRAQAWLYMNDLPAVGTAERTWLDAMVDRFRVAPAAYSYFLADEPKATQFAGLGRLVSYLRERDPNHMAYINTLSIYGEDFGTNGFNEYLDQYINTVHPAMLCYDLYNLRTWGDGQLYLGNLSIVSRKARQAGIPFMPIVQACGNTWEIGVTCRVPNANELRFLVYSTAAFGAQGISYFNYSVENPSTGGGLAPSADGTPTSVYTALTPLNKEFKNIAAQCQLLSLKSIGGYLKGYKDSSMPMEMTQLPIDSSFDISSVSNTLSYVDWAPLTGVLFGLFDQDGTTAADATFALIQNLDYNAGRSYTVTGPGNLSIFDATTGVWRSTGHNYALLDLAPGGGVLVGLTSLVVPEPSANTLLSVAASIGLLASAWRRR